MIFNWKFGDAQVIDFESVAICALPRESRLVLTVYGRRKIPESVDGSEEREELGWTSHNFFRFGDPCWTLVQGANSFLTAYLVTYLRNVIVKI